MSEYQFFTDKSVREYIMNQQNITFSLLLITMHQHFSFTNDSSAFNQQK